MKVRVKKLKGPLEKHRQRLRELAKSEVNIGHFSDQGTHESGYSYPELMELHHNGSNPEGTLPVPPRPVLKILRFKNKKLADPRFKAAFKGWKNTQGKVTANKKLLTDIGTVFVMKEKEIFGSSDLIPNAVPPKDRNEPLVDTGDLRSKVEFRTSL